MIVILLQGGLGNQMFEYATAFSFAKDNGQELLLLKDNLATNEHDYYRLDKLSISYSKDALKSLPNSIRLISGNRYLRKFIKSSKRTHFRFGTWEYITQIRSNSIDNLNLEIGHNALLDGYWQNPANFSKYKMDIVKEFMPSFKLSNKCIEWERVLSSSESVSLHIRRGDYLKKENAPYLLRDDYYRKAIDYISSKKTNAKFFVFSDDKEWCRIHFPNYEIIELENNNNSDIEEMYLMSKCKNNINANSSFSWWGAYINNNQDRIVINPERIWNYKMIPSDWYVVKNSALSSTDKLQIQKASTDSKESVVY